MICHLRAAGTGLVLDARGPAVPAVVHWGTDLGPLDDAELERLVDARVPAVAPSSLDVPFRLSLLPTALEGWTGRPGISGAVDDGPVHGPWALRDVTATPSSVTYGLAADDGTRVTTEVELTDQGVLRVRHTWTNVGAAVVRPAALATVLPVPDRAQEVLDHSGTWAHERRPQRGTVRDGAWVRESRHGRPGHDHPYLLVAGTPGFGFGHGEVWGLHVGWSGDTVHWVERQPLGVTVLGGGELLAPGELRLGPGEEWTTPWTYAVWSDAGLDGLAERLHGWVRATSPVPGPRPVTLNTWEAVYFDHDLDRLRALADAGARIGVERFVLDDGWFQGRTDDRRALGDWTVDTERWPHGLHPLADHVTGLGMELGLWVEPEMVSPDSATAREHPDWVLSRGPTWRHQHVLDLAHPDAYAHVLERLDALVTEYPIAYLKWDHNRDVPAGVHAQTTAVYRLLDELRARHPGLEVEACASGGARVDLGILERVDRFWTSDDNDPLERQTIQRWSAGLVPPEYLGSHVGPSPAHTTGRASDLGLRLATALFGSAGLEWDLTRTTPDEQAALGAWVGTYRDLRGLLHSGRVVRLDGTDPAVVAHGVVAPDGGEALVSYATLANPRAAVPAPLRMRGLDPTRDHRVAVVPLGAEPRMLQDAPPAWWAAGGLTASGRVLTELGLPMPLLLPGQAAVLRFTAV
ncbi:alpha-galactosidase [Cellulomonas sp. APG4]|uniref:alpha-galactosidase n=1 Tax=Cellulomonas sp. APG4 TaxID=1538656 RepID=UPI00351BB516